MSDQIGPSTNAYLLYKSLHCTSFPFVWDIYEEVSFKLNTKSFIFYIRNISICFLFNFDITYIDTFSWRILSNSSSNPIYFHGMYSYLIPLMVFKI